MTTPTVRPLPPLNDNYSPPQPWKCITHQAHECTGNVIGAVGAIPVCVTGAEVEGAAVEADRQRREALMADPSFRAALAAEAAMERRIEFGR